MTPICGAINVSWEEAALTSAVCADPDDDTPRVVFADWLDEHGRHARAEFIRVQCELAKIFPDDRNWAALYHREQALWAKHWSEWERPFQRLGYAGMTFRRGFPWRVVLWPSQTDADADEIFAHCPTVEDVNFSDLMWSHVRSLVTSELPGRFSGVHFIASDIHPAGCTLLARECSWLSGIQRLNLSGNQIGPEGAESLAHSQALSQHKVALEELHLNFNRLNDAGLAAISSSSVASRLRVLGLTANNITDYGAEEIIRGPRFSSLEVLDLRDNLLTPQGISAIVHSSHLPCVRVLGLGGIFAAREQWIEAGY